MMLKTLHSNFLDWEDTLRNIFILQWFSVCYVTKWLHAGKISWRQIRCVFTYTQIQSIRLNPSCTKGFGTHTKHQGGRGVEKDPPKYLKNEKCHKPETFEGVRSIL